jgi:hypothetical protein
MIMIRPSFLFLALFFANLTYAQTDSLKSEEEDYSMYENLNFAGDGVKRFCSPKVFDLSPAKLISMGYDYQGPFNIHYGNWMNHDSISYSHGNRGFSSASGMRLGANIPIIARTNIVLQAGFNYIRTAYSGNESSFVNPLDDGLREDGLRSTGIHTTLFKPLSEEKFIIFQGAADLNGDYDARNILPLKYIKYSGALIYGKKVSDRKMFGFGLSRTYRVGELNYIPVMLLNWTSASRKWGIEMLAPARFNYRRTLSPRSILLLGYELEGNSYRLFSRTYSNDLEGNTRNIELRRSELRIRATWETSLYQFFWMSLQLGYRYGYGFNLDQFPNDREFFRGFTGSQVYKQENSLGGAWYAQLSLNLVSP